MKSSEVSPPDPQSALDDFLLRAGAGLDRAPPAPDAPLSNPRGDHDLEPAGLALAPDRPHRRAAVLVPVLARSQGLAVLLTERAAHLRDHSGQIGFPGGKIEPGDADPAEAALREAHEEVGLPREAVRVLGHLDPYLSATGFLVVPVVGLVTGEPLLRLDPGEVADAFEVPLAFLMDARAHRIRTREWRGRSRRHYAIAYGERLIWGVTAGIIHNLHERLFR